MAHAKSHARIRAGRVQGDACRHRLYDPRKNRCVRVCSYRSRITEKRLVLSRSHRNGVVLAYPRVVSNGPVIIREALPVGCPLPRFARGNRVTIRSCLESTNNMKACVRWQGGVSFLGESGSGHTVLMDGPPESGGTNQGSRPMELLLMGTGGCAAVDVVLI